VANVKDKAGTKYKGAQMQKKRQGTLVDVADSAVSG
jgi:hypothetical protein